MQLTHSKTFRYIMRLNTTMINSIIINDQEVLEIAGFVYINGTWVPVR